MTATKLSFTYTKFFDVTQLKKNSNYLLYIILNILHCLCVNTLRLCVVCVKIK